MYSCDYYWIRTGSFKTLEYVLEMQGEGARGLQESLGHATAPPGPSREANKQITVGAQGFAWHGLYVVHSAWRKVRATAGQQRHSLHRSSCYKRIF